MKLNLRVVCIEISHNLLRVILIIFNHLWNNFFHCAGDNVVGNLIDRSIRVAVYADDDARLLHTGDMLNLTGDAKSEINFWTDCYSCLTNLAVVVNPACIDSGTRSTYLSMKLVGKFEQFIKTFF